VAQVVEPTGNRCTNLCLAALFSPLKPDDAALASLAETAIFFQWFHSDTQLHYARWQDGEIDIVMLGAKQKASWAAEVKWSDRYPDNLNSKNPNAQASPADGGA